MDTKVNTEPNQELVLRLPLTMASARRRPLSLDHLFAAPLVRETVVLGRDESDPGLTAVKQHNYASERDVITRYKLPVKQR